MRQKIVPQQPKVKNQSYWSQVQSVKHWNKCTSDTGQQFLSENFKSDYCLMVYLLLWPSRLRLHDLLQFFVLRNRNINMFCTHFCGCDYSSYLYYRKNRNRAHNSSTGVNGPNHWRTCRLQQHAYVFVLHGHWHVFACVDWLFVSTLTPPESRVRVC